jgi:hypothetical protein
LPATGVTVVSDADAGADAGSAADAPDAADALDAPDAADAFDAGDVLSLPPHAASAIREERERAKASLLVAVVIFIGPRDAS